jgi:hypothetical protein
MAELVGDVGRRLRFGVSRRLGDFVIHVCGVVVTIKRPGRTKIEVPSEQSKPFEEYMRLASISLRTARYQFKKGIVEQSWRQLAPAKI